MALITKPNSIPYALETLNTGSSGVIISNSPLDCSKATDVKGFDITAYLPSGTAAYYMFKLSNGSDWCKLSKAGKLSKITAKTPDFETLELNGNSTDDLKALTAIPAFVGKKILVAIGLSAQDSSNAVPSVKLAIKASTSSQLLNTTLYSPTYQFENVSRIAHLNQTLALNDGGSVTLYAQLTKPDGSLSDWVPAAQSEGLEALGIQLRADYAVPAIGSASASLSEAIITFTDSRSLVTGAGTAEIVSLTQDWYLNIRNVRMVIKHKPLNDSVITPYVAFRSRPTTITGEQLGIGTGSKKIFQLSHPQGIKYDTLRLYFDQEQVFSGYELNAEVGRVSCTAPEGAIVSCDYEADWGHEEWQKLSLSQRYSLMDYDNSEYRFSRPESDTDTKSICAVKIALTTKSGSVKNENVGTGTGKSVTYKLAHAVKDGSIKLTANGSTISAKNYELLEDPTYIRIAAPRGTSIKATYDWLSESPVIHQFAAVFSD